MAGLNLSEVLNAGGLGILALLCLVVLGHNAWNLNSLVKSADPKRINAARSLLLAQMAISLIGLLTVGGGAIFLDKLEKEDKQVRKAQILLDPWERRLSADVLPIIDVAGRRSTERPITVECTPGQPTNVAIDMEPFIVHRISNSIQLQRQLKAPGGAQVER